MDIYHKELMKNLYIYGIDYKEKKRINAQFKYDDKIIVKQLDDITKTKYTLVICNKALEKVTAIIKGKEETVSYESFEEHFGQEYQQDYFKDHYYLDVDFDNCKPEAIKLYFIKDIVDPIVMDIEYVQADKDKYYETKQKELYEEYKQNVAMDISTGINLINVYFNPCCDKYYRTEVELYLEDKQLGIYNNKEGKNFITINGLGNKTYSVVLIQYDKDNNKLYESLKENISVESSINNDDDWDYYDEEEDEY